MRFIIYGVGAIGGTIAVRLATAGHRVVGIARGAQLEAMRAVGLKLRTPDGEFHARPESVEHPSHIEFDPSDIILLCLKSQHTSEALLALRDCGVRNPPIVCMQNGVANETAALRVFENVIGVTVMLPATFLVPGEIIAFGTPKSGVFDVGGMPSGVSPVVTRLCGALDSAGFAAFPHANVMHSKYGKLLLNISNGVEAVLGPGARNSRHATQAKDEAQAVYAAAGIAYDNVGAGDPRRAEFLQMATVDGIAHSGSSSVQSLARGAGSIETDYLNGEIVLLGRLHGVPTPVNALVCALAGELARSGGAAGSISEGEFTAML
jgi:2-dehydropantoate 2-reductase